MAEARGFDWSASDKRILFLMHARRAWRKRGDSNLREPCGPTRFRVVRLQPLGHASVHNSTIKSEKTPHKSQKYVIIKKSPQW